MKWNSEKLGEYDASKLLLLESRRRRGRTRVDDSLVTNAKKRKKIIQDSFVAPGNYSKVDGHFNVIVNGHLAFYFLPIETF